MFKKNQAFTMAETLLVIAIIGVVAALTIPNMSKSVDEQKYVSQLKTEMTNIKSAYKAAREKYGDYEEWIYSSSTKSARSYKVGSRILEYMNVDKDCENGESLGCFSTSDINSISGEKAISSIDTDKEAYKAIVSGSSYAFLCEETFCRVVVDLDGPQKGYNTYGIDIFDFNIEDTKVNDGDISMDEAPAKCYAGQTPYACTAWVLRYSNMDYRKCSSTLNSTSTSCN